ncbi:hypothetical protein Nepgr_003248 [Nepenthes gracilis]|uniref:Uncharacterized protein n=1 Tax=Nepenthes gracilis TaxID=150966 RepID=A0AAD3XD82_NEPGR|nr:hypothetical protein Nepgr_003248 [Nepenthes gracilis]
MAEHYSWRPSGPAESMMSAGCHFQEALGSLLRRVPCPCSGWVSSRRLWEELRGTPLRGKLCFAPTRGGKSLDLIAGSAKRSVRV